MIRKVERYECECEAKMKSGVVCGHIWTSRIPTVPFQCPRCLSRHWDVSGVQEDAVEVAVREW